MTLSLHVIVDNCPPERLDRAVRYLKNVKQAKYVNIGAGAQLDRGMQFVDRVKAERSDIKIIWRDLNPEDTGIHTRMTPVALYNLKVKPRLEWFKRNQLIFMPDNESSGDDAAMRRYATWETELAALLHTDGLRGAFCRFSTGTIQESQYGLLKPIFNAMLPGDIISPNEYSNAPGLSSGGHLARYQNMYVAAGKPLDTVIGEAGMSVGYDPGKGYQSVPVSGAKYGQQMLDEEIWYSNGKIDRCLYLIGGYSHQTFQLGDDVLNFLEDHYMKVGQQPEPPIVIPPPQQPPQQPPVVNPSPPIVQPPLSHEFCIGMAASEEAEAAIHDLRAKAWRDLAQAIANADTQVSIAADAA